RSSSRTASTRQRSRSAGRPRRSRACLPAGLPCRSRRRESPRCDVSYLLLVVIGHQLLEKTLARWPRTIAGISVEVAGSAGRHESTAPGARKLLGALEARVEIVGTRDHDARKRKQRERNGREVAHRGRRLGLLDVGRRDEKGADDVMGFAHRPVNDGETT